MKYYTLPKEVRDLIIIVTDGREDGYTVKEAREQLEFINDTVNNALTTPDSQLGKTVTKSRKWISK